MAQRRRNLISPALPASLYRLMAALLASVASLYLPAQAAVPVSPPSFRAISLDETVNEIFYDYQGKPVAVTASPSDFSAPYPIPESRRIAFYKLLPQTSDNTTPRKEPLQTLDIPGDGAALVFMAGSPFPMPLLAVDASLNEHPQSTARIFNFSRRPLAVNIGSQMHELSSSHSKIFPYPDGRLWLKVASKDTDGWKLRVSGPQLTVPNSRSVLILTDQPTSTDRPDTHALLVRNLLDFIPMP